MRLSSLGNKRSVTTLFYPRFRRPATPPYHQHQRWYGYRIISAVTNRVQVDDNLNSRIFHHQRKVLLPLHSSSLSDQVRTMNNEKISEHSQQQLNENETKELIDKTMTNDNDDDRKSVEFSNNEEVKSLEPKLNEPEIKKLGTAGRLKLAVRDYGGTVVVFHVTMSIMSLGSCYVLVSSGLDIIGLLERIGISEAFLQSKITQGGSTFVLAYAIHKVFAPVRLGITLTAVPFIVKKLRGIGILKTPL